MPHARSIAWGDERSADRVAAARAGIRPCRPDCCPKTVRTSAKRPRLDALRPRRGCPCCALQQNRHILPVMRQGDSFDTSMKQFIFFSPGEGAIDAPGASTLGLWPLAKSNLLSGKKQLEDRCRTGRSGYGIRTKAPPSKLTRVQLSGPFSRSMDDCLAQQSVQSLKHRQRLEPQLIEEKPVVAGHGYDVRDVAVSSDNNRYILHLSQAGKCIKMSTCAPKSILFLSNADRRLLPPSGWLPAAATVKSSCGTSPPAKSSANSAAMTALSTRWATFKFKILKFQLSQTSERPTTATLVVDKPNHLASVHKKSLRKPTIPGLPLFPMDFLKTRDKDVRLTTSFAADLLWADGRDVSHGGLRPGCASLGLPLEIL